MFWMSSKINLKTVSEKERQSYLWRCLKAGWQFSQFYGDYQSLPPSKRRQFVNDFVAKADQPDQQNH